MYQLRKPSSELASFIEHYWFVGGANTEPVDLRVDVYVDGRADLIFNFEAPYIREEIGGGQRQIESSNLDAQRTVPIRIIQRGQVHIVGVRFQLGGVGPFSTSELRPFTDRTVEPSEVFGDAAEALALSLQEASSPDECVGLLDTFFLKRLQSKASLVTFTNALNAAVASAGNASVAELAQACGVSSRQVDRLFARYLGLPPKTLSRILRFQCALKALMADPGCTLAEVAARAGYYDQAHFVKDFRQMTGGVPRGYRGYYPPEAPNDFAPNVVVFLQDAQAPDALSPEQESEVSEDGQALVGQGNEGQPLEAEDSTPEV